MSRVPNVATFGTSASVRNQSAANETRPPHAARGELAGSGVKNRCTVAACCGSNRTPVDKSQVAVFV
ncbi:hypothetical protein DIPPA_17238 [Diplonema papillatum]|nr:hypothetical protein DIPPA_17238 [Diplonema papillatum]